MWRSLVKRTCRLATLQAQAGATYESWHSRIIDTMLNAGIVFNINPRQLHGAQDKRTDLRCWCQRSFQSTTALAVHQWKAHGTHAPEFYLAKDTYCPCCLKNFWSLQRVRQHLAYMPRHGGPNKCYQQLIERGAHREDHPMQRRQIPGPLRGLNRLEATQLPGPLPLERVAGASELEQAESQRDTLHGCAQERGLFTPLTTLAGSTMWGELTKLTEQRCRDLEEGRLEVATYNIEEEWIDILAGYQVDHSYTEDVLFLCWGQQALPSVIQTHGEGQSEAYLEERFYKIVSECVAFNLEGQLLEAEARVRALQRKVQEPPQGHRPVRFGTQGHSRQRRGLLPQADAYLCQQERERSTRELWIKTLPPPVHTPMLRTPTQQPIYLVLHLFAGRRRDTDFHCKLMEMADRLGLQVQVLSLDVAIDQEYGNLDSSSQNWAKIAQAVSNGWVAAAVLATLSVRQGIINLQKQKDVIGHGRCARRNGLGESPGSSPKRCGSFFCEAHSLFRRYGL